MKIRELQNLLTDSAFNPYINIANSDKVLLHLVEEIGELVKEYRKKDMVNISNEIGDIQILLCFFGSSIGLDVQNSTLEKIKDNIKKGKFLPKKLDWFDSWKWRGYLNEEKV